jgi:hypothetical protein
LSSNAEEVIKNGDGILYFTLLKLGLSIKMGMQEDSMVSIYKIDRT